MTATLHAMTLTGRAEEVAQRCKQATLHGQRWQARCPAHDDHTPSLSIAPGDTAVVLKCFAGCELDAILAALGLTMADLFVDPPAPANGYKQLADTYEYYDEHGALLFQVQRLEWWEGGRKKKIFPQRRPDPTHPGAYINDLDGVERVLYNLPQVLQAVQAGDTVYIVEGEKDVKSLLALGLTATCNPMGVGKWRDAYSPTLRGAEVVIFPDNDTAGRTHAADVARSLTGIAAHVRVVLLPGLPDKGDVTDWLQAGHTLEDLHAQVTNAPDMTQARNGDAPGPEPPDPYACPDLPAYAQTNTEFAEGASLFLDDYIKISKKWAPRAYEGFHEAVALFLLSTIAARRLKVLFGPRGVYTSLYSALAARTTVHTKSTTADIGMALLAAAGLSWLLADDDSTPQAFLRSLSLYVPSNYAELPPEEQEHLRRQLAFAGQRGWFYEEWGQHLEAMMQKNGYMASFRSILRRMDDHKDRYTSNTIARGREILHKPYVSLLANVTPSDLQPFVKARSSLWRDGYIARFAFVTPDDTAPSDAEFPEGSLTFPGYLVTTLQKWHTRLGIPTCTLTPTTDKKGEPTGTYAVTVSPLPEKVYTLSPAVRQAYYAYDRAMRELTRARQDEDLDGSYGRFPGKALRIAGLLASLHDDGDKYTIWPAQWHRGQQIAERWRRDLHRLMGQVAEGETETRAGKGEQRVLTLLRKHGALSAIEIHRWTKLAHTEIVQYLDVLGRAGAVRVQETGRTKKYALITTG